MKEQIFNQAVLAKAHGTISSYLYNCKQFFKYLKELGIDVKLPIQDEIIAAYLVHKKNSANSDSVLTTSASAIKWIHSLINAKPNPVDSPIVQQIIISGRRQLHKPPVQKEPLPLETVQKVVNKFGGPNNNLMDLRIACYISIKFSLLFRHDEMAQLKASHISELPDGNGLSIFIPRSKTDIFREGSTTFISDTPANNYSPVSILKSYLAKCNTKIGEDVFVFTALSYHPKQQSHIPLKNKPLSYTRCRELFLDALEQIGVDNPRNYGLHSLRSGGASHLANKGVSEELLMQHGRWKTTTAKNRYVKRDLERRLDVSKILNAN